MSLKSSITLVWLVSLSLVRAGDLTVWADDSLTCLTADRLGRPPHTMLDHYMDQQAKEAWACWQGEYEALKTPDQIQTRTQRLRRQFRQAVGDFPERTPLRPRITGIIQREGYRVEKVIFESQPGLFVTAALFVPESERFRPPLPGVLVPCGHYNRAKAWKEYQAMGALLALNGMAALVFDPLGQGERMQLWGKDGKQRADDTRAHDWIEVGGALLGRGAEWFINWDGIRALDYLVSRPEVDPERIGCTGNSGGGTQTAQLLVMDDRIEAAAISCYISRAHIGDAEQNIFGSISFGFDHADFLTVRAPQVKTLLCAATHDGSDINATWSTFRYAKRLYTRLGFSEHIEILENDAKHNYNRDQRQGVVRWMARWLQGRDEPIWEPKLHLIDMKELYCTPNGKVVELAGARTTYDINREYERDLAAKRRRRWRNGDVQRLLQEARDVAAIRPLAELPRPGVDHVGTLRREGCRIEKLVLGPEPGIWLPALLFGPEPSRPRRAVVYLNNAGKAADAGPDGPIEKLVSQGATVLAVDVRGIGETAMKDTEIRKGMTNPASYVNYKAFVQGRSLIGMRVEDIWVTARYLRERLTKQDSRSAVELIATGEVGVAALHAAALEPQLFESVVLRRSLVSFADLVHSWPTREHIVYLIHSVLRYYDLPELAATLGNKLTVEEPIDTLGRVLDE
jgi:cephalosporin-C deacetylase-like acetyl esterase